MSVQAINWALKVDAGRTGAKCVLLTLANYADAEGICWPSQSTIARNAEQSVDTVQRHLKQLEARGLIERRRRQHGPGSRGGRKSDEFLLMMKDMPQPAALPRANHPDLRRSATEVRPQSARAYKEEPSRTVRNKLPHQNWTSGFQARGRAWRSKDGAAEAEIAKRIGRLGWDVLSALPVDEVAQLCARQRFGRLDEASIAALVDEGRRLGVLNGDDESGRLREVRALGSKTLTEALNRFAFLWKAKKYRRT